MKTTLPLLSLLILSVSSTAFAQATGKVSSGATEVAAEGKEKPVVVDGEIADATELAVQGGGLLAGGNSRSFALTSSAKFLLRRDRHEFNAIAAVNYASSSPDLEQNREATVENYQGRLRYDYFYQTNLSAFFASSARRDRFQGLNLRLGIDPGLSAFLFRTQNMKLWAELGYSYQHDIFNAEARVARLSEDPIPDPLGYRSDHNARGYLGYHQRFEDRLQLDTGLEVFKSVIREDGFRLNFATQLTTQLIDKLSFAVGVNTLYDNTPVPGVRKLDVQSSMSFVYTLL